MGWHPSNYAPRGELDVCMWQGHHSVVYKVPASSRHAHTMPTTHTCYGHRYVGQRMTPLPENPPTLFGLIFRVQMIWCRKKFDGSRFCMGKF